ncbi:hypothetical protein [Actinoplanes sp. NPDC049265]|uniref:hypothetical protein n=1 Tax=Actinoplanes sp. NPDC049265 TaxID=3363902 RepID=UPI00372051E8
MATKRGLVTVVAVLLAVLAGGSGCSPEPATTAAPRVATLASPSTGPAASPSVAPSERPRYRLDTTREEEAVLLRPYYKCLKDKSGFDWEHMTEKPPPASMKKMGDIKQACSAELPLPAWEEDPANPEAKDFAHDVVACLKRRGANNVHVGEDGIGLEYDGGYEKRDTIRTTMDMVPDCQREVAATKKD